MRNPYNHYRQVVTETADPVELVIMLYRGSIKHLTAAEEALRAGNVEGTHASLIRAQDIVAELMGTLRLDVGEVARNLHQLYDYMQTRLIEANLRKELAGIVEVRGLLVDLLETWVQIGQRSDAPGTMGRQMSAPLGIA